MQSGPADSRIQEAQRTRVVVDAIVQAGLTARLAFSLAGGLSQEAHRLDPEAHAEAIQAAQQAAHEAKNADMTLDMVFVDDAPDLGQALRDAADALEAASQAYATAAELYETVDR